MAYCGNCGNALEAHQRFCPKCGHPAGGQASEQQPAAAPPPPPTGYYQAPAYDQGQGYAAPAAPPWSQPQRKSRLGMWIGIGAAVVVIAVALGLIFGVFKDDIFGGGGAASTPEQTVRNMLTAMENKDADTVLDLLEPGAMESLGGFMSEDALKEAMSAGLFEFESLKFSGIELSTEKTGETSATVTIIKGSVTITDNGEAQTEDVSEADEPVTFDLVKIDGSWYLDPSSLDMF